MKSRIVLVWILALIGLIYYIVYFGNVQRDYTLKLSKAQSWTQVMDSLREYDVLSSRWTMASFQRFHSVETVPAGYYKIKRGMSNRELLQKLKYGIQDPIRYTLSTATFVEEIASRAGDKLSFDSLDLMNYLLADSNQHRMDYTSNTTLCLFLPNTHELYWTSSPDKFIAKFYKDYQTFWNENKTSKAQSNGLTPNEVYILASMVQKEYSRKDERSRIAGVLLNRLRLNMPLQVDATCKYATRDFAAKRVTSYHTQYPSPYNTYLHTGLTPGPICVPERETIDAVLNAEKHDYIYYCADPSLNGYHIFSKTFSEHNQVANQYHRMMNERKEDSQIK